MTSTAPPTFTATVPEAPPLTPPVARLSWFMAVTATPWNWAFTTGLTTVWPVSASNWLEGELGSLLGDEGATFGTVTEFVETIRSLPLFLPACGV
jgi:hypothetical protein